MALKTGISGLRGTVESGAAGLTADTALAYARAFATHLAEKTSTPTVVLGRDGRRSSRMLADLVRSALLSAGCRVLDLGLSLTPTVQFTIANNATAAGGVMITASHNPIIWNGLKFLDNQGRFLPRETWDSLHRIIDERSFRAVGLNTIETVQEVGDDAFGAHRDAVQAALPVQRIRTAGLRVALDACNSGAVRWITLLEALGCEVVACNTEQHGYFAREAEPLPAHLSTLRRLVRDAGCDLGLAADPDGDRLALVDENGEPVNEEHTVVLCARERLLEHDAPVVVNVVTTHAIDDLLDTAVHRTAVGEMNVVNGVLETNAVLGGEGSGGIIVPAINMARDGMAAAGLILSLIVSTGRTLSELVADIPRWHATKTKIAPEGAEADAVRALFAEWHETVPNVRTWEDGVTFASDAGSLSISVSSGSISVDGQLPDGQRFHGTTDAGDVPTILRRLARTRPTLDLTDGVKLAGPDGWISLRPSNTEPIIRVMGEIRELEA